MRTLSEVIVQLERIDRVELSGWIERGWIVPAERGSGEPAFSDLDLARARLICELRRDLAVEEETIPLVLSLLDQLYAMRRRMNALAAAIQEQPEDVRSAILQFLRSHQPSGR